MTKKLPVFVVEVELTMFGQLTIRAKDEDQANDRALDVLEYTMGDALKLDPEDMSWKVLKVYPYVDPLDDGDVERNWPDIWDKRYY